MVSCETKKTPAHQVHYTNKMKHHSIHILLLFIIKKFPRKQYYYQILL